MRNPVRGVRIEPVERLGEIRPRSCSKKNARHSPTPTIKLGVDVLPANSGLGVSVKSAQTPFKLGVLRRAQPYVLGGKAIPKLADEVEALLRGQPRDV